MQLLYCRGAWVRYRGWIGRLSIAETGGCCNVQGVLHYTKGMPRGCKDAMRCAEGCLVRGAAYITSLIFFDLPHNVR